jgi:hypothetical protein
MPLTTVAFGPRQAGTHGAAERARTLDRSGAPATPHRADRQAIELVSRLFDAMLTDEPCAPGRGFADLAPARPGHAPGPARPSLLDKGEHPLWNFINRSGLRPKCPPTRRPGTLQLLKVAQGTIDQLASEPEQNTGLYRWAARAAGTVPGQAPDAPAGVAGQPGRGAAEAGRQAVYGSAVPSTMHGTLDVPQLDTVPAHLMDDYATAPDAPAQAEDWLSRLRPGDWVRIFLQGRWVQAQAAVAG